MKNDVTDKSIMRRYLDDMYTQEEARIFFSISIFRLLRINVYCSLCLSSTSSRIADSKVFVSLYFL